MESISRKIVTAIMLSLLLSGCLSKEKTVSNPGFDEVDSLLNISDSKNVSEQPSNDYVGDAKSVFSIIKDFLSKVVKGLFGDKAWYYIGAAIVLLLAFKFFETIGLVVMFLILMFIFKVLL